MDEKEKREFQEMKKDILKFRQKLKAADEIVLALDLMIENRCLDARSLVSDLRLNYGQPNEYEHLDKEFIKEFRIKHKIDCRNY